MLGCHKLSELYRIFEAAGGDLNGALQKNYATRPHHLVLLAGFTLPEQDNPPPPPTTATAGGLQSQAGTTNLGQQQPSPAAAGLSMNQNTQQQVASSVTSGQGPVNVGGGGVGSPASLQQQQHQQQQQNQQQSQMVQQQQQLGQQQIRSSLGSLQQQQPNMPPLSQGSMIRCGVTNVMMRPAGMNTTAARARWQSPLTCGQQQQDPSMVAKAMQGGQQMNQPGLAQQQPQQAQQQQQQPQQQQNVNIPNTLPSGGTVPRTTVWQGTLEFQEKKDGSNPGGVMGRGTLQVPVKMNSQLVNGEPEVKTDGWPMNLVLQWIPKSIISGLGNSCLKQAHTVMFLPEQCPALTVLTSILSGLIVSIIII